MALRRRFIYHPLKGEPIPLPDIEGYSDEQVRNFYSMQYPELTNAAIHASDVENGVITYGLTAQPKESEAGNAAPAGTKGDASPATLAEREVHLRPSVGRKG